MRFIGTHNEYDRIDLQHLKHEYETMVPLRKQKLITKKPQSVSRIHTAKKEQKSIKKNAGIRLASTKKTMEHPPVDPVELIKIRMEDFGFTATDWQRNMAIKER